MNISEALNFRYTTKSFDATKKISPENFDVIKQALRLAPSSTNLQPWNFVVAEDESGKARVAKGAEGFFSFNAAKITNASHVVVFASKVYIDEAHFNLITQQEDADGRYPDADIKTQVDGVRRLFCDIHRFELKDEPHWNAKQVYINMGTAMLAAASLGIDACPMEGVDLKALDEEFGLKENGYSALAVVAFGYRAEDDFNDPKNTPKSRLPENAIISKA